MDTATAPSQPGLSAEHHRAQSVLTSLTPDSPENDQQAAWRLVSGLSHEEATAKPEDGITLLMLAASAGAMECVDWLVTTAGAAVNDADAFGCDALYYAVRNNNLRIVDVLLQAGAAVDAAKAAVGGSALIEAAILGNAEIATLLCAASADPNAPDVAGDTAVRAALRSSSWDVAAILGCYGAKWGPKEMACAEGGWHCKQCAGALEAGRSAFVLGLPGVSVRSLPIMMDPDGMSALHICAKRNWPDGARWLLHARADPRSRDSAGRDPLFLAASSSNHPVIRVLLANGANPFATTRPDGMTALMGAAAASSLKAIILLFRCLLDPADLEKTDTHGRTALRVAIAEGASVEAVALLMGLGHRKSDEANKQAREALRLLKEAGRSSDQRMLTGAKMMASLMDSGMLATDSILPNCAGMPEPGLSAEDCFMWGIALRRENVERAQQQKRKQKRENARRRRAVAGAAAIGGGGGGGGSGGGGSGGGGSGGAGSAGAGDEVMPGKDDIGDDDDADGAGSGDEAAANNAAPASLMQRMRRKIRSVAVERATGARLLREADAASDVAESETPSEIVARLQLEPEIAQYEPAKASKGKGLELRRRMKHWQFNSTMARPEEGAEVHGFQAAATTTAAAVEIELAPAAAASGSGDTPAEGLAAPASLAALLSSPRLPTAAELEMLLYDTSSRAIAQEAFDNDAPDMFRPAAGQDELVVSQGLEEEMGGLLDVDDSEEVTIVQEDGPPSGGVGSTSAAPPKRASWTRRGEAAGAAVAREPPFLISEKKLKALERKTRKE